jgi:hypothetical protein
VNANSTVQVRVGALWHTPARIIRHVRDRVIRILDGSPQHRHPS